MSTKKNDLKTIKKYFEDNDIYGAVLTWNSSYHLISEEEFIKCSDICVKDMLEIIDDDIQMLQSAKESILETIK